MSKKVITAALAGIMSAGMVTPVLATEGQNLDALNKAAYDATMKAEKEKTQGSVNAARAAIKALLQAKPDSEYIISLVGTYSQIVDGVQQPILSNAVTSVKNMNANGSQANINEAYTNLPEELKEIDGTTVKEYWRNYHAGLKAQIDDAQSALQVKTSDAVKKAQAEKTPEAIKAAQDLVTEVSTSVKPAIVEWAKIMQDRLDAIEIYNLKVTEVVRINKTTIDVRFDKLTEELKDVTLTVKDSNGKVYEVETKAYIAKGATEASFTFKKALDNEPTGAWLVNGVGYDATAKKVVDDVIAADSQQKLADAIKSYSGFTGYDELNVGFYYEVLVANRDKIQTVSDVQKLVIDAGNENAVKQSKVKDIVESPNNVVLGQRMIDAGIKRVNKNWLDKYNAKVGDKLAITGHMNEKTKFSDIQARIDKINKDEADEAVRKILNLTTDLSKVNDTISLVNNFYPEDSTEDKNAKKLLLDQLQIQKSLCNVAAATTPESVINALKHLSNDNKEFGYAKYVNENLGVEYLTAIKAENNKIMLNKTSTLEELLEETTNKAIDMALGNHAEAKEGLEQVVGKINISSDNKINDQEVKAFEAALDKLAKATSLKTTTHTEVFDLSKVNKNLYVSYIEKLKTENDYSSAAKINNVIKEVNENAVSGLFASIKPGGDGKYESKALLAALNNATENFGLKNVNKANDGLYAANGSLFEKDSLKNATKHKNVDTELQALQLRVDEVNALAIMMNSESTVEETQNALKDYRKLIGKDDDDTNNEVIGGNISSQQLADVAQLINQDLKDDKAVDTLEKLNDRITSKISKHGKVMSELNSVLSANKNQNAQVNFESASYNFSLATSDTESEVKKGDLTISEVGKIDLEEALTASGKVLEGYTLDVTNANEYQAKLGVVEITATKVDAAIEKNKEIKITIDVRGTVGNVNYSAIAKALADVIPGADIAEAEQVLNGYIKDRTDKNDVVQNANYTNFEQIRNLMK